MHVTITGSTKEKGKVRATAVEAKLMTDARTTVGGVNFKRAPVLRDFLRDFSSLWTRRVEAGHLDPDTKKYYHYGWKQLEATTLADMRIDRMGTSDASVISFSHGPSYANQAFRTLRRMLHMAVEWNLLRAAPKIKTLEEQGRTALIEPATEALLLEYAPQPLADVLTIIMDAGMRPEEVMRTRKEHIFWDRSVVLVPYGKTFKSQRHVPLSDRMRAILRLRELGDSPWIFPSKRARSGHLTTIAKQWTATVEAAPVSVALVLFCARHTFGTDMLEEGMNVVAVSKLLGHDDVKTTMKYLHPDTSEAAVTVNKRNRKKELHLLEAAG